MSESVSQWVCETFVRPINGSPFMWMHRFALTYVMDIQPSPTMHLHIAQSPHAAPR